jgi:hypothetical protein
MAAGNENPDGASPGEQIAAEMVKHLALSNINSEKLQLMLAQNSASVDELCGYFECFSHAMGILADMKDGSKTKRLSLDDFVHAWGVAEDEVFPDDDSGGSKDDDPDGDGDDDGGDPPVLDPDPVGAGDRRA